MYIFKINNSVVFKLFHIVSQTDCMRFLVTCRLGLEKTVDHAFQTTTKNHLKTKLNRQQSHPFNI